MKLLHITAKQPAKAAPLRTPAARPAPANVLMRAMQALLARKYPTL